MEVALFGRAREFLASGSPGNVALSRCQSLENRIQPFDRFLGPANHHAVAALQSPHSAAGSYIDVMDAFPLEIFRPPHIVFEIGIAAIDDRVSGLHVGGEFLHRGFGRASGRNHDPNRAWRRQLLDEIFQRRGTRRAFAAQLLDSVGTQIGNHQRMSPAHQPPRHVRAHAAQSHHS